MTSTSLLASAMVFPASIAASTASSPAVPDEAHSTTSTSGCVATAIRPSRPPPQSAVPAGQASRSAARTSVECLASGHRHRLGPVARDLLGEARDVPARGQRDDPQAIGMRVDDRERALADRAGRSEDGDALHQIWR